jgi:CDP-diacylglycerol--glycerol-3-phosphate 3-phosphatidyltransferase
MALRNTILADYFYRILERTYISKAKNALLTPNQVTALGLALAVFVPFGFLMHPFFGFLFIVLSGCADAMDGMVAKNQGLHTAYGAFLDSSVDRISDFLYLFGFWVLFWNSDRILLASGIVFFSLLFTFMISYIKARVQGLGGRCDNGLMERGMRTFYLVVWAFSLSVFPVAYESILWSGLIVYCALSLFTVIQRITLSRAAFEHSKPARL